MDNQEASSVKQQFIEVLRGAESVVVTTKKNPGKDAIAAAIGLHFLLEKLEKVAEVVIVDPVPQQLQFLPTDVINKELQGQRDFVVEIDQSRTEADHLKYVVEEGKLKIYITPYNGSFSEKDASFSYGDYHCDAIIGLGVQNQEEIDESIRSEDKLTQNAQFLLLNPGGSGQSAPPAGNNTINWVDPNANSVCEMIMSMSEALGSGMLDDTIATALLTGIIERTEHFTNQATTPKIMTMSAQLLAAGARQGEIMKQLSQPDASGAESQQPQAKVTSKEAEAKQEPAKEQPERPPNEFQIRKSQASGGEKSSSEAPQSSQSIHVRDTQDSAASGSQPQPQQDKGKDSSQPQPPQQPQPAASTPPDAPQAQPTAKPQRQTQPPQQSQGSAQPQANQQPQSQPKATGAPQQSSSVQDAPTAKPDQPSPNQAQPAAEPKPKQPDNAGSDQDNEHHEKIIQPPNAKATTPADAAKAREALMAALDNNTSGEATSSSQPPQQQKQPQKQQQQPPSPQPPSPPPAAPQPQPPQPPQPQQQQAPSQPQQAPNPQPSTPPPAASQSQPPQAPQASQNQDAQQPVSSQPAAQPPKQPQQTPPQNQAPANTNQPASGSSQSSDQNKNPDIDSARRAVEQALQDTNNPSGDNQQQ